VFNASALVYLQGATIVTNEGTVANKRDKMITVRVTEKEREELNRVAHDFGCSLQQFCLMVLLSCKEGLGRSKKYEVASHSDEETIGYV